ncbi:globin domain-containing protein [Streptomyces chrestomyceticus]
MRPVGTAAERERAPEERSAGGVAYEDVAHEGVRGAASHEGVRAGVSPQGVRAGVSPQGVRGGVPAQGVRGGVSAGFGAELEDGAGSPSPSPLPPAHPPTSTTASASTPASTPVSTPASTSDFAHASGSTSGGGSYLAEAGSAPAPSSTPGAGGRAGKAFVPALGADSVTGAAGAADTGVRPSVAVSPDAMLIRRTLDEIEPVADKVTSYFYALLFVHHPGLRALFPAAMDVQRDRLFKALLTSVENVDDTDYLTEYLSHLGRGHRKYGTLPEHYPAVGECLLSALARYASGTWNPETEAAWVRAYTTISQIMIDAAAEDEAVAPAWWQAEVVSHELRTPDIAVVTVRPDQPYPFLAGQYASVETPWWPRIWRHYSFAAAPRSDGLLSFHVKAVPAGWVSNAMVHRARPGDVVRLGPPSGSMTVDHTTDNGLLCLGGGTGIAPIKALVEDVAERGHRRPMEVFYGARSGHDLYDLDTMLRLEQSHPWLSVRPVVATGGRPDGPANSLSGQLPDAVRQYGPWREYDAYLSGPPGMIRNGVDALVGVGIPSDRIRHDSVDELVAAGD